MNFTTKTRILEALFAVVAWCVLSTLPAYAAVTAGTVAKTGIGNGGGYITATSTQAVLSFQLVNGGVADTFASITVSLVATSTANLTTNMFNCLANNSSSGIRIYNDVNGDKALDGGDSLLALTSIAWASSSNTTCGDGVRTSDSAVLQIAPASSTIAASATMNYLVAIELSGTATDAVNFRIRIPALGIGTTNGGQYPAVAVTSDTLVTDLLGPVTTPSATSPPGGAGYTFGVWTVNSVRTDLSSCVDAGAGCAVTNPTAYCVDATGTCSPTTAYSGPVDVTCAASSACVQYISYFSTDTLGNIELASQQSIKIDTQPPVTSVSWTDVWSKNSTETVSFIPNDGSGVGSETATDTFYCVDTTNSCAPGTNGGSVDVLCSVGSLCTQYVRYYSIDNLNNTETATSTRVRQDLEAPVSTDNWTDSGWFASDSVTFEVYASDGAGSGINSTLSCQTTNPTCTPATATSSYTINCAGALCQYYICYKSLDNALNSETTKCDRVRQDNQAPTTTDDWPGTVTTETSVTVTLNPSDGTGSGVASTKYCVDTANTCDPTTGTTGTSVAVTCGAGVSCTQYVRYLSTDTAGNVETVHSTTVQQSNTPPVTTDDWTDNWTTNTNVTVTLTPTDNSGSGLFYTRYCIDTVNACTPDTDGTSVSVTCPANSVCTQYVRYNSRDNLGNTEVENSKRVRQDAQKPTTTDNWVDNITSQTTVTITLTPSDGTGIGLASPGTWYCVDTTDTCVPGTASTTVTVNCLPSGTVCTQHVRYFSKDQLNNTETVNSKQVRQGSSAPNTTDNWTDNWTATNTVAITLTPTDTSGAGIQSTWYCIDTANTCTPPGSNGTYAVVNCLAGTACTQYLRYFSRDNLLTEEAVHGTTIRLDTEPPVTTDNWTDAWTATMSVNVVLTPSDGAGSGLGAGSTVYCVDTANTCVPGTAGTTANVTCAAGTTCVQYVRYRTTDLLGNVETIKSKRVRQDSQRPSTTDNWTDNWINTDTVNIILTPTDNSGSGIQFTKYCIDTANTCDPSTVGTDGVNLNVTCTAGTVCTQYVRYFSRDNLDFSETPVKSKRVRQDTVTPATTDDWTDNWTTTTAVTVNLTADDGTGSGIAVTNYCVDTTNTCTPSVSGAAVAVACAAGSACTQYVRYASTDVAGTTHTVQSARVRQDSEPPTTTDNWTDNWTTDAAVAFVLAPGDGSGSGVQATLYCVDTANTCAPGTSGTSLTVNCATTCTQYVRYFSRDNKNNVETVVSKRVRQDTQTPVTTDDWVDNWTPLGTVNITLSPTDNTGAGIQNTWYCVDTTNTCVPTTSGTAIAVTCAASSVCTQYVRYFSRDNINVDEPVKSKPVRQDLQLPATTDDWTDNWTATSTLTVTLTPTDGTGSGLAGTWYCVDTTNTCAPATAGTSVALTCTAGTSCTQYVRYFSQDNVSANETINSKRVRLDTGVPSGGSMSFTNGYYTTASVSVTTVNGADDAGGSGVATRVLQRRGATMAGGVCGAYGAWGDVVSSPGSPYPDNTVLSGNCYEYRFVETDSVSNQTISTSASTAKVDTSPATCSIASITEDVAPECMYLTGTGTILFYSNNPTCNSGAGQFTVTVTAADTQSGIQNVTFPTTVSAGGSVATAPYSFTYNYDTSDSFTTTVTIAVTNNAGANTNCTFDLPRDFTESSGGSIAFADGYYTTASVPVTFTNGTDNVGGAGLASRILQRRSATLADGTCGTWGAWADLATDPVSPYTDNTVATINCYQYRYSEPDNVANNKLYTTTSTAKVNVTPPTCSVASLTEVTGAECQYVSGNTIFYNNNTSCNSGAGSHSVAMSGTTDGSGVQKITFPTNVSAGGDDTTSPFSYTYTYDSADTSTGVQALGITDNAGLTGTCNYTLTRDATAPSGGSISYIDGFHVVQSVEITLANGTDNAGGAGVVSRVLQRSSAPLAASVCGTFTAWADLATNPASPYTDSTVTTGNCFVYRYLETDNVSNQTIYTNPAIARIDVTQPSAVSTVNDGSGTDIDATDDIANLGANWTVVQDPDTLYEYFYALGTTAGGVDVINWTSVGTSTFVNLTGLSLVDGVTYYFSVKARNDAGLITGVTTSDGVLVDTTPPILYITTPTAGQAITGSAAVTGTAWDNALVAWHLYYGPGTAPTVWKEFASGTVAVTDGAIATWDSSALSGSYTLKLTVQDLFARAAETTVVVTVSNTASITKTLTKGEWHLVAVPVQPSQHEPVHVFGDSEYRVYRWDEGTPYDPVMAKYTIPGWLNAGSSVWIYPYYNDLTYTVTDAVVDTTSEYTFDVKPGWTQLGTPFNREFAWDAVRVRYLGAEYDLATAAANGIVSNTLYTYLTGLEAWTHGAAGQTFKPGTGYFVRAYANAQLVFYPGAGLTPALMRTVRPVYDYSVALSANTATTSDTANFFGSANTGAEQYDMNDVPEPPPAPAAHYTSLYFPRADWGAQAGRYTGDLRPLAREAGDTETFPLAVETSEAGQAVTLSWDASALPSDQFSFTLINEDTGEAVDMAAQSEYTYVAGASPTQFRIVVVKLKALAIEQSFTLEPGWNLISVPLEPEVTSALVQLGDDLPLLDLYQYFDGRFYAGDQADIQAGLGYWVHVAGNASIDVTGVPLPQGRPVEVPLAAGWNLIGCPFQQTLAWGDNIQVRMNNAAMPLSQAVAEGVLDVVLYRFDGRDYTPQGAGSVLEPWRGYLLKASRAVTLILSP